MKVREKFTRIDQVVAWRLCMGCGACVYACPNEAISLVDIVDVGIRPRVNESKCQQCHDCVKVCPGIELDHEPFPENAINELKQGWGPILQLWEGYAADQQIRYAASSGGVATALALYGLESGTVGRVLHIGVDKENPIKNVPVYSKTKKQLLSCTGSRYAPAAPCQAFGIIKEKNFKSIFIGKPCDVEALSKARKLDPELDEKVAFMISIFCAGTPTTKGTLAVLEQMGVSNISELESFRYRGNGWPGRTTAVEKNGKLHQMEYEQSWGNILSKHGQLRCRLCPDGTGEFADISCGDPWYREIEPDEPGRSLILVRTEMGQQILQCALGADYVGLQQVESAALPLSQKNLHRRRCHLWGRLIAMRAMQIAVPSYTGFNLRVNWRDLSISEKIRSIIGTLKRIILRKLYKTFVGSQE